MGMSVSWWILVLGLSKIDLLMQRALMWLKVYGREAVRHKLKNSQKNPQKMHF
jgi:hypothetical protein